MSDYPPNKVVPGTVYQVIQLLGQGGMGTVYEVEDTTVGKRYVLKTLHAQLRDRKELAAKLHKEARTLARLSHPNIVEVVTAGMTTDALKLPYFVMQKLNGHTLRSVLSAKGCLPLETAYSIAIDLLDALDHAHSIGVIHRDVKPENIFLHRGPNDAHQTKLLDFGVMQMLSSERPESGARFVGTIRYAPPEQLRGGHVTPRTDLYAAGLVLYEMIAGGGPFDDATTDRELTNAHLEKRAPPLATRLHVPPALDALLASALAKDPAARPRDAFTFAARLRALSREAASARGASAAQGTIESVLGGIGAAPSATNLDDAGAAPTGEMVADGGRGNATTTGAIESHASEVPATRRGARVAVGVVVVVALAATGVAMGTRGGKGHAEPARGEMAASASATGAASATATATATATASATASPNATAPASATPTPVHRAASPPRVPATSSAKPHLPRPDF